MNKHIEGISLSIKICQFVNQIKKDARKHIPHNELEENIAYWVANKPILKGLWYMDYFENIYHYAMGWLEIANEANLQWLSEEYIGENKKLMLPYPDSGYRAFFGELVYEEEYEKWTNADELTNLLLQINKFARMRTPMMVKCGDKEIEIEQAFLGKCAGIGLRKRGPNDNHICFSILCEDDGNWFVTIGGMSSFWIEDLKTQLDAAMDWIKRNAVPDPSGYGWAFKE